MIACLGCGEKSSVSRMQGGHACGWEVRRGERALEEAWGPGGGPP